MAPLHQAPNASPDSIAAAFHDRFDRAPDVIVRAPGRVNLLGAHVDYNDGFVLPIALASSPLGCPPALEK